jgi:Ribonuclease G/E
MPKVVIHAAWSPGEVRIAAMADGVLRDYLLWRPGSPNGVGDIYRGRVTAIVPAMAGAFVTLATGNSGTTGNRAAGTRSGSARISGPLDTQEGFLPDSERANGLTAKDLTAKGLTEGAIVVVRITRAAQSGKGPRLSARIDPVEEAPGDKTLGMLRRGLDPLREIAARYPHAAVQVDDPALAATLRADLGDRLTRVPHAFGDAIEAEVESLGSPEVTLASGVRLSIHPTPALVAIDVDGGGALGGQSAAVRTHLALNMAVLPELARQIRLRDLSGAIMVDLAGLKAKQRASLAGALASALAEDPLRPRFLGFTALGLAEISRPRVRAPLHEALAGPLAAGLTALRAIARASRAEPGQRLALRAAPAVIAALEADPVALAELARITGQGLNSRSDPSLLGDGWLIEALNG